MSVTPVPHAAVATPLIALLYFTQLRTSACSVAVRGPRGAARDVKLLVSTHEGLEADLPMPAKLDSLACGLRPRTLNRRNATQCPPSAVLTPETCPCASQSGVLSGHEIRHVCRPTPLCSHNYLREPASLHHVEARRASTCAFVAVLHTNSSHVPLTFARAPRAKFRQLYARAVKLFAGLQRVNSTLALHVLISGEDVEQTMHLGELAALRRHGVLVHRMPSPPMPHWASWNHRSAFAKLLAFNMSRRLQRRLIYLDHDVLILGNIDHLCDAALVPTPAVVFRGDSELLNTGLMVLDVRSQRALDGFWRTARARFACSSRSRTASVYEHECLLPTNPRGPTRWLAVDGGDQEVFIHWAVRSARSGIRFGGGDGGDGGGDGGDGGDGGGGGGNATLLYELPTAYNAFPWQMNHTDHHTDHHTQSGGGGGAGGGPPPWCRRIYVLHKDTNLARKGVPPECVRFLTEILKEQQQSAQSLLAAAALALNHGEVGSRGRL